MASEKVDRILTGKYLLPLDEAGTVIDNGGLAISGTAISAIGDGAELIKKYPEAEVLAEPSGLIMPGLVNVHTHAAMACFRGLADDLPLMEWLQDYIFPREAKLTSEVVYHSTLLSICEMIKSGTTSFCDMYLFAGDVARAVEESGMRAWIGEVLYDFPSPNYGPLEKGLEYTRELIDRYSDNGLVSITIDPHAVYTCSPELLTSLGDMAAQYNLLYHIHLAENDEEVNTCRERYGCTPVEHLNQLGLLGRNVLAAHCVKLTESEIRLLAEQEVKVAHCPESNMKLASGTAPIVKMLDAGVTVGIGTDGSASNNDVDMFGEMATAAKIHKVTSLDPTAMNAVTTLLAGTMGGAECLGAGKKIGSLEPGKQADCIVIDLDKPHLTPLYNPISHLIYAARGSDVVHSVINGKVVMRDRKLLTLDEPAILNRIREIGTNLGRPVE